MECYSGGSIVGAVFSTIVVIALLGVLAWWIYKKFYCKHRKGEWTNFKENSQALKPFLLCQNTQWLNELVSFNQLRLISPIDDPNTCLWKSKLHVCGAVQLPRQSFITQYFNYTNRDCGVAAFSPPHLVAAWNLRLCTSCSHTRGQVYEWRWAEWTRRVREQLNLLNVRQHHLSNRDIIFRSRFNRHLESFVFFLRFENLSLQQQQQRRLEYQNVNNLTYFPRAHAEFSFHL